MKKIFKFAAIATAVMMLFACEKPPQSNTEEPEKPGTETPEEDIDYTEDIAFELELKSLEADAAEITISHNGTEDDTWYAFATTSTNVNVSLENMIEELTAAGGKVEGLSNGTRKTVKVRGLEPDTKYTYIVFAITADGDVYGTHEFIRFTTPIGFGPNPAWAIEYTGRQFIGNEEYEHTVTVTSSDENPYFMTIVTKERFDGTDIKTLLNEELDSFKDFIDSYNKYYGIDSSVEDWSYTGSAIDAFGIELGYTYVAMAIGASPKGELTGLYAVSEEFEPYEEEMTPEYASWLGNWTLTGANGVAFDVTIAKDKSNTTYAMTGWETPDFDVIIDWYPTENTWILWSQYIGTYTSAGYGDFDLYFVPAKYVDAGQEVYASDGLPICIGCDMPGGERMVIGYSEDGESLYSHMRFAGIWADGIGGITATTEFPTFPLTVTPASSTQLTDSTTKLVRRKASTVPFGVPCKSLTLSTIQ
jgi:hypothetical protein